MIVLLGSPEDVQIQAVSTHIDRAGVRSVVLDSAMFPQHLQLSYRPDSGEVLLRHPDGGDLQLSDIHALYWRTHGTTRPAEPNAVGQRDSDSLLLSFLTLLGDRAVNSADAVRYHREKARQLAAVCAAGIRIPPTYIGNDADAIRAFCSAHEDCIFKPVVGGDYAQRIGAAHLEPSHLERALRSSPITLQRFVTGTNVRTYVIGHDTFSAEIRSAHEDFRLDRDVEILPITLPAAVEHQALQVRRLLGLAWTAIDWRRDDQGSYHFLEANPSPMFVNFERNSGFPLSQRLAELLIDLGRTGSNVRSATAASGQAPLRSVDAAARARLDETGLAATC